MRLFLDQDVYETTRRFLEGAGHDVLTAAQAGRARAADIDLLRFAEEERRILVTRDRDFGRLAQAASTLPGILYLRSRPRTLLSCHRELTRVLDLYPDSELSRSFVVVEPGKHRIRRHFS